MKKIMQLVLCKFVFVALCAHSFNTLAAIKPQTHCKTDEKIIFSCLFKNKRNVSLCASSDLSKKNGTLQYRYGVVGKPFELIYPTSIEHPSKHFSIVSTVSGRWHQRQISFKTNEFTYSLLSYENLNIPENEFSLSILKNLKKVSQLYCNKNSITDETWLLDDL